MRRTCYVCGKRPPKRLKSIYKYATQESTFCSRKCAAEFGLLIAASQCENGINWCRIHGWWDGNEPCAKCEMGWEDVAE